MLRRLDLRVPLLLSLILAGMVGLFGWRLSRRQGELNLHSASESARLLALAQANDAAHFLVISEFAGLEQHLLEAALMPGVVSLEVFESDGTQIFAIQRTGKEAPRSLSPAPGRARLPPRGPEQIHQEGERLVVWAPIEAGTLMGWLRLGYSLASVGEVQTAIWGNTAAMGALLVLAGSVLIFLVLKPPLRAIRELATFAHDLNRRKGDQTALAPVSREIDELAAALNRASAELASAEGQLIAERERLAVTIRSIGDGVIACDREGRVLLMNRVAEGLTGWSASAAWGRPFAEVFRLVEGADGEPVQIPFSRIVEEGRPLELPGGAVLVARDGLRRPVADSGAPILDVEGRILGMVVVFRDETARLQEEQRRQGLQEQLRQSQKMEAVGQMAGGIAHDFNNILTAIIGFGSMILARPRDEDSQRECAHGILRAAERAAGMTRSLLAFSRKQKMELRNADLNEILRNQEHLLRRLIGEDIALQVALAPGRLIVRADAGQVEQVILNLVMNARDAMPRGGMLSISSEVVEMEATGGGSDPSPSGHAPFALVCVSDSGEGMDGATLGKIFEPFFTTKPVGKGTGLGLAIVHGIVQQHGATIRVYSHPGIGTSFKIYFPLLAEAEVAQAEWEEGAALGGTEKILLVEDEGDVRQVVAMMLENAGYQVIVAEDGASAVCLLDREAEGLSLVVTDVIMPGMTGRELRDRVAQSHPGLRVLFLTGYTADVVQYKGLLEGDVDLLMKPFSTHALLARVREVLDRPAGGQEAAGS